MLSWLANSIGSIITIIALIAAVAAIIAKMIIDKKHGKTSCECDCGCCAMKDSCHKSK